MIFSSCPCASCASRREAEKPGYVCKACDGSGRVLSALGSLRPCSRCAADDFTKWRNETLA